MLPKWLFSLLPVTMATLLLTGGLPAAKRFEGAVVVAAADQITVHDFQSGEYVTFILAMNAEITLDGAPAAVEELFPYFQVTVVAGFDGENWTAGTIDATSTGRKGNPRHSAHRQALPGDRVL